MKNAAGDAEQDVKSSPPVAVDVVPPEQLAAPHTDVAAEKPGDIPSLALEDFSQESAPPLPSSR